MLISFNIENFLSFGNKVNFSMVAGKVQQHKDLHTFQVNKKKKLALLKISAIYGANASGKSNLIKTIELLKRLIIKGTQPEDIIPLVPFKLNSKYENKPSKIEIVFIKNSRVYAFGFLATNDMVYEEWLYDSTTDKQKLIYERKLNEAKKYEYTFLSNRKITKKDKNFVNFIAEGTRKNQLFLTECFLHQTDNNFTNYRAIRDTLEWVNKDLLIIFPNSKYQPLLIKLNNSTDFFNRFERFISIPDTGIDGIELKEVKFNDLIEIPDIIKQDIKNKLKPQESAFLNLNNGNDSIIIEKRSDKEIIAKKLYAKHYIVNKEGYEYFDLKFESDGTRRLFDLIPLLIEQDERELVVFIDELNRSLHPLLTKWFIDIFINQSFNKKIQLIFTTHEEYLLDFDILRKDEIWFTEKNENNETNIYSLAEFKDVRFDKRIVNDYLLGRYGAIPKI
jgi:hypothetical protein